VRVSENRRDASSDEGAGGDDVHGRMVVVSDLEKLGGLRQPAQDQPLATGPFQEPLRIFQSRADPRALAVENLHILQTLAERGFPRAPHPREPHDPPRPPCRLEHIHPEAPRYHSESLIYR
jgi:hypothetical protein